VTVVLYIITIGSAAGEEIIPEKEMITKKWITLEKLSLVQEKRILKKKRDSSELADREYRQKCNEVRKAARAYKAKWLERVRGHREILWRI